MQENVIDKWFAEVTGSTSLSDVSKKSGVPIATLHRQKSSSKFTAESVVKIARAFGSSVPDALIAHGIVSAGELSSITIAGTLADATDQQLLDEMARRLHATPEGESEVFDAPNVGGSGQDATVHDLDEMRNGGLRNLQDDLKAVASERGADEGVDNYDA